MTQIQYPEIETERLLLKELTSKDAAGLFLLFSNPDVTRYMDIDPLQKESEALEIIEFHFDDSGCRWGLYDRETSQLIGTCGYHLWRKDTHTAEIGYDLSPAYWGKGIMQEALNAIIDFGFNTMDLRIIEAEVEPENKQSIRLLEKLNFHPDLSRDSGLDWFLLFKN